MNAMVWNARGLGSSRAFSELRWALADVSRNLVFICETKLTRCRCANWRARLGYDGAFFVDAEGQSGGLLLLWRDPHSVSIRSFSKGHIDCLVEGEESQWRFTGFYGNPVASLWRFSWDLLYRLKNDAQMVGTPWLVGGDFNEILFESEKIGGKPKPQHHMQKFREVLQKCDLRDVVSKGSMTWFNKRSGNEAISERLDRLLVNQERQKMFTRNEAKMHDFYGSDHRVLTLRGYKREYQCNGRGTKHFHFEEKWMHDAAFVPDFLKEWEQLRKHPTLPRCLNACKSFFTSWAGNNFDDLGKQIKMLRQQRVKLLNHGIHKGGSKQHLAIDKEIERLTDLEESHWKMRARTNWLSQGDRNTKSFHAYATGRRKKNLIHGLENEEGQWMEKEEDKANIMGRYFSSLFTTSNPSPTNIETVVSCVEDILSNDTKVCLAAPYTKEEIERVVFEMHPSKSPGPDGFHSRFFQKLWPEVGDKVLKSTLDVLNNEADLSDWNKTLLVFIPKTSQPRSTKEFRPISLCNTIYKIVSKVLVNRLRGALGDVVDQNQSVFLSGRQITDNIIVGFECMHWIKNRKNKKSGFAALKLDMSKAYDRIEWSYVEALLNKLNFPESMTRIIMRCISTVRYSMVINGRLYGNITPSRGLRQGDPLSPLLFVLCAQGLSSMLHKLQRQGNIQGVQFGKKGSSISHLLFADDSLLFFKADIMSSLSIKNCLRAYEEASGQVINFEKSAITFSSTTPNGLKAGIQEIFNIKVTEGHAIYLGLPTASMRNKRMQFGFLRERVLRKLELWKNKHISADGKEVLLKIVVQAIPNYTMAYFKVPDTICKDIDRACARFWWGGDETRRKLHWCKWETLCVPKEKGGLGFRRLIDMNKAMLAKQVWRFLTEPKLLAARVLKAKYFQHSSILDTKVRSNALYIWRSICGSRSLISRGLRWKIGRSSKLKVGNAAFVPNLASGIPTPFCHVPDNLCIIDLMDSTGDWDRNKLEAFSRTDMVKEICQVRIRDTKGDCGYWKNNDNGKYTVKYGYLTSIGFYEPPPNQSTLDCKEWAKLVWNLKIPPKLKVFYWKELHNFLPVPDNLIRHHIPMKRICEVCGQSWGTTIHSLFLCTRVKHVWKGSRFWEVIKQHKNSDIIDLGRAILAAVTKEDYELWITTMWVNWTFLCQLKHRADSGSISIGLETGRSFYESYREACIASRPRSFFGIPIGEKIWKPPVEGIYRIDVDACYDFKKSLFGIGVVIRNSSGGLCAALAKAISDPGSVLEGELIAMLYGAELCLQEVLGPVVMFSDSLLAVRNVKKLETNGTESLECFNEFAVLLHQGVILDVCHMYREANSVAHALARFGALSSSLSCWITEFPTWLHDVVSTDFLSIYFHFKKNHAS